MKYVNNSWISLLIKVCLVCLFLQAEGQVSGAMPEKIVYLYDQPINTEDINGIIQKIEKGEYTDTTPKGATGILKSAWIYIPAAVLKRDTLRNYLLIGCYEHTDLYELKNGRWSKSGSGGLYIKFSEEDSGRGRYFFKLFGNSTEISDGYLIACRRYDDYVYSRLEGRMTTQSELKRWKYDYDRSKEWFNRMTLPFWGILILTTLVLGVRFLLSGDKAYLMYAIGNSFFTGNCILLYFIDPANIQNFPLNNPMLGVAVTGPVFIMGVGFFILSFRYFYTGKQFQDLARSLTTWSALACLIVSVVNTYINYHYKVLFITNIIMYVFLVSMIVVVYMILYYHRKVADGFPITTSFLTIVYGSFFIALSSVVGFVLSEVYAENSLSLGKFHLQSFPLLIGIAIYNAFVLVAFSKRDHQIHEEANNLKIRAYEYEVRVLQNSLNPHFIFNSLNLIDFFVYRKDLPQARNALFQFSDLLRMVIDKTTEKSISLTEELKMLDLYLKLECSRNMDLFTYSIETAGDIDTDRIMLPPLIIQPLAENAIRHGILNKEEDGGHVSIVLSAENGFLQIEVKDNGIGFRKSSELTSILQNKRKHLGLELTRRRIELLSEQAKLEVREMPIGEGAIVLIKIPL